MCYQNEVYHIHILQTKSGHVHFKDDVVDFASLEDLVEMHAKCKRVLPCPLKGPPGGRIIVQQSLGIQEQRVPAPQQRALVPPSKQRLNVDRGPNLKCKCRWEIDINELEMIGKIGNGAFGVVHQAKLRGSAIVAVKIMIKGCMSEDAFIKEAEQMT